MYPVIAQLKSVIVCRIQLQHIKQPINLEK